MRWFVLVAGFAQTLTLRGNGFVCCSRIDSAGFLHMNWLSGLGRLRAVTVGRRRRGGEGEGKDRWKEGRFVVRWCIDWFLRLDKVAKIYLDAKIDFQMSYLNAKIPDWSVRACLLFGSCRIYDANVPNAHSCHARGALVAFPSSTGFVPILRAPGWPPGYPPAPCHLPLCMQI